MSSTNKVLVYTIVSGNGEGSWNLESNTGNLRTSRLLDRETTPNYQLTVRARDDSNNVSIVFTQCNFGDQKILKLPKR